MFAINHILTKTRKTYAFVIFKQIQETEKRLGSLDLPLWIKRNWKDGILSEDQLCLVHNFAKSCWCQQNIIGVLWAQDGLLTYHKTQLYLPSSRMLQGPRVRGWRKVASLSCFRALKLKDRIIGAWYKIAGSGSWLFLWPRQERNNQVFFYRSEKALAPRFPVLCVQKVPEMLTRNCAPIKIIIQTTMAQLSYMYCLVGSTSYFHISPFR